MKRITFKQFIETFNFRNTDGKTEDTDIIRIHIPKKDDEIYTTYDWLELGVYDFSDIGKQKVLTYALSDNIKNSYIEEIRVTNDEEWKKGYLEIYLTNEEICK